jgi:aconitate hydratase
MAPEYGATCGFFGIDDKTLDYLRLTGREEEQIALVEAYAKEQGFWIDPSVEPIFSSTLELDLVDRRALARRPEAPAGPRFAARRGRRVQQGHGRNLQGPARVPVEGKDFDIGDGDVVIAAITSCTNTSNPGVLIAAGLVAKKADELGLKPKPWVKTSLAPGSQVVTDYLERPGCSRTSTTSASTWSATAAPPASATPARWPIRSARRSTRTASSPRGDLGQPQLRRPRQPRRARQLPGLAAAGRGLCAQGHGDRGLHHHPDRHRQGRQDVFLKDIWPTNEEVYSTMAGCMDRAMFQARYADVYKGDKHWQAINVTGSETYVARRFDLCRQPALLRGHVDDAGPGAGHHRGQAAADARRFDHHRPHLPAGNIKADSPAGQWLLEHQVAKADFNSYGARRGHHEVMMRGTFANIRIKNEMVPGVEGGFSRSMAKCCRSMTWR